MKFRVWYKYAVQDANITLPSNMFYMEGFHNEHDMMEWITKKRDTITDTVITRGRYEIQYTLKEISN